MRRGEGGAIERPQTRYARSGDIRIAYQVYGDGPIDVVHVPGFVSHLELGWELPGWEHNFRRYGSFSRLIRFDKRGTGLSDRVDVATLEERIDDVRAVMDAAGSERAVLVGISEGGPMSVLFAATYPERTSALVLVSSFARISWAPDYPWGLTPEAAEGFRDLIDRQWGDGTVVSLFFPSVSDDERARELFARVERYSASPKAVLSIIEMIAEIDVRHALLTIGVPTLVMHHEGDPMVPVGLGRYLGEHIPGAKYVELAGGDHVSLDESGIDTELDEIEEFLTGVRHGPEPDRVLATVLFTDIVGSTERQAALGDRRWRELLDRHHALVGRELERYRGRRINTTGDGVLATFDGPARAVRCASAIAHGVRGLGVDVRAGLHTGEIELAGDDVTGIAVHTASRVAGLAGAQEVLVSSTVVDLVAGSGLDFVERGEHALKGVPRPWRLYAVAG